MCSCAYRLNGGTSATPTYRLVINLKTVNDQKKKINLSNYTINNKELKKKLKPFLNKEFRMKDALVKIFATFYGKNKNSSQ